MHLGTNLGAVELRAAKTAIYILMLCETCGGERGIRTRDTENWHRPRSHIDKNGSQVDPQKLREQTRTNEHERDLVFSGFSGVA
jgi:hypothetical protein